MFEDEHYLGFAQQENTLRVKAQREKDIFVVICNPPYNAHQMDENDNNKNRVYKKLEQKVRETYSKDSKATNKNALADPYVKAIKWASDRIGDEGVVAMITNNSFLDNYAFDGMRKHLEADFDSIYVLDLGGNVRKNPKLSGTTHNVFGIQVGVSINIFIKRKYIKDPLLKGVDFAQQNLGVVKWNSKYIKERTASQNLINDNHHLPYRKGLKELARDLRNNQTKPEKKLWYEFLKNSECRFKRQHPVDNFIVDFYCPRLDLIVEIDGDSHDEDRQYKLDIKRTWILEGYGLQVIRFGNRQVMEQFESVCESIDRYLKLQPPTSSGADEAHNKPPSKMREDLTKSNQGGLNVNPPDHSSYGHPHRKGGLQPPCPSLQDIPPSKGGLTTVRRGRKETCIYYARVDEFWKKEEKYNYLEKNANIVGVNWKKLSPSKRHLWLTEGMAEDFEDYPLMGDKRKKGKPDCDTIFNLFSNGVKTNRDVWAYNFHKDELSKNMKLLIETYNGEVDRWDKTNPAERGSVDDFVQYDDKRIKWDSRLKSCFIQSARAEYKTEKIRKSLYRPFISKYLFHDRVVNNTFTLFYKFFPTSASEEENRVICTTAVGNKRPFQSLISKTIPDLHFTGDSQCFPFYTYNEDGTGRRENITDNTLKLFRNHYKDLQPPNPPGEVGHEASKPPSSSGADEAHNKPPSKMREDLTKSNQGGLNVNPPDHSSYGHPHRKEGLQPPCPSLQDIPPSKDGFKEEHNDFDSQMEGEKISKWDIFYYIYAMLHHPDYRNEFKENLKRSLPRIPFAPDFWTFADIGRRLADLHLNYEKTQEYDLGQSAYTGNYFENYDFRVEKMRLSKDKTELYYNHHITLSGIPSEAFEYKLGNRSALEWIIDQYRVKTDRRSGIVHDPNGFDGDRMYIFKLIGKIVTVSMETVTMVNQLSSLPYK